MYKQIYHTAPVIIVSEVFNRDFHTYIVLEDLKVCVYCTDERKKVANSFVNTSSHYWHSLPSEITAVKPVSIFNRQHKHYVLNNFMA